jgi:hypothetical protein
MLENFHIHWASVTFSKKIINQNEVYVERKNKIDNKCDIEVNYVNDNGENVVTTNLNLIHFFNIQKRTSYIIFVKRCPNYPQNEILHICHLTYQNGMNEVFL